MLFCKNPDSDVPILELYDQIGVTYDEWNIPTGIDGREFAECIKFIEGQGKKGVDIYINSMGGSIIEGMTIVAAIKSCSIPVNTHCVGVAVSMAGVILQAGKSRKMVPWGQFMTHPPSGGDPKDLKALTDALVKMLTPRTNMTQDNMADIMEATTWLNAEECLEMKLIDEIADVTSIANLPEIKNHARKLLQIVNSLNSNTQTMDKTEITAVNLLLELPGDATDRQTKDALKDVLSFNKKAIKEVINAVTKIRNVLNKKNKDEDVNPEDAISALKKEMEDMKSGFNKMADDKKVAEDALAAMKTECDDLKDKLQNAQNAGITDEATAYVKKCVTEHRIKAEVEQYWIDMYIIDKDLAITGLEGIPVRNAGAKMPIVKSATNRTSTEPGKVREINDVGAEYNPRAKVLAAFNKRNSKAV